MRIVSVILLAVVFLNSCKKAEDRTCMKSAGSETTIEVSLPSFEKVKLGPHINFTLVQDTINKMIVTGGENLVKHISSDFVDDEMVIENNNKCNFLRSYKKEIDVEVHFVDIKHLTFEGTRPLNMIGTLTTDYFLLLLRDGAGTVNMDLNCLNTTVVATHGWTNFDLSGNTNYLKLEIRGNGFGSSYDLNVADSINVISHSSENIKVNSNNVPLRAEIDGVGDVWYKGIPSVINVTQYGEGELLDKN